MNWKRCALPGRSHKSGGVEPGVLRGDKSREPFPRDFIRFRNQADSFLFFLFVRFRLIDCTLRYNIQSPKTEDEEELRMDAAKCAAASVVDS